MRAIFPPFFTGEARLHFSATFVHVGLEARNGFLPGPRYCKRILHLGLISAGSDHAPTLGFRLLMHHKSCMEFQMRLPETSAGMLLNVVPILTSSQKRRYCADKIFGPNCCYRFTFSEGFDPHLQTQLATLRVHFRTSSSDGLFFSICNVTTFPEDSSPYLQYLVIYPEQEKTYM